jgi:urease accessory protein
MLLNGIRCAALAAAGLFVSGGTASAHHLMGGKIPSTFAEGVLSGVGHPIIGPDHLAFLVALGIAVGVSRISLVNPFLFLVAMACGVVAHVAAVNLPAAELVVAVSVLVAGVLLALNWRIPASLWLAIFAVAGFFHGYAYGESIYGAEPTPLIAYLAGLVAVQTALTVGVAFAARSVWTASGIAPRLVGAAVSGVGFAVLVAQIIPSG